MSLALVFAKLHALFDCGLARSRFAREPEWAITFALGIALVGDQYRYVHPQ